MAHKVGGVSADALMKELTPRMVERVDNHTR
jgi:hypothetical protein